MMSGKGGQNGLSSQCQLRTLPLFESVRGEEWPTMDCLKAAPRYAARDTGLLREGEVNGHVHTLLSGWAFRYKLLSDGRRQLLGIILPGDAFGLEAFLGMTSNHSVQTVSDVTYCAIDRRLLVELSEATPRIGRLIVELLVRERQSLEARLACVGRCNAEERIAYFLLDLHSRLKRRQLAKDDTFNLPLTQQQMADSLGLNIIHTNRVLRRLRDRGLFELQDHRLAIRDMAGLRRLAGMRIEAESPWPP